MVLFPAIFQIPCCYYIVVKKNEREKGDTILSLASDLINCVCVDVCWCDREKCRRCHCRCRENAIFFHKGYCSINRPIHMIGWWNVSFGILFVAFLLASFWYIWIKEFHIKSAQILISQYAMAHGFEFGEHEIQPNCSFFPFLVHLPSQRKSIYS